MIWSQPPRGREPLAWAAVGVWVGVIYLTIPLARTIQRVVQAHASRNLFLWATLLAFGLVAAAAVRARLHGHWQATMGQWAALGAVLGLFSGLAWSLRANPEEALHFVQYGLLGLLLFRALAHRLADPSIYLAGTLIGAMFGICDELIQWLVPNRFFDYRDIGINTLAGLLTQAGLWAAIRPAFVRGACSRGGLRLACSALAANALLLLFCTQNTPAFQEAAARWIPALARVNEITVEYGHRIEAGGGTVFNSRLAPEELRRQDRERGSAVAQQIGRYRSDGQYLRFLHAHPAHRDPLAVEARIHIFRRDRYAAEAHERFAGPERETAAEVAWREQQILAAWFPCTLGLSPFAWPADMTARIQTWRGPPWPRYYSPVSRGIITWTSRRTLGLALLAVLLAALAGERRAARRPTP